MNTASSTKQRHDIAAWPKRKGLLFDLYVVKYSTNVKATIESLVTDSSWQEHVKCGQLKYGVRYTGDHLEEDLKQAMIELENQYLVTCIL